MWTTARRIAAKRSVERMRRRDKRIILVHTPVHASWLNQVEIYFSIIQRKVLTPNDFANLEAVRVRLALYEELSKSPAEAVRVEVHSTGHAGLAKTCVAAFFSSFRCLRRRNRETTTLFVKRTTKG